MDLHRMEEFRSNLLLLLQCGHPEGLAINQLKSEYKQYFYEDVGPEVILPRGYKNNKHWDALFQLKEFKEDFTLFYLGTVVYVKAIRKRNHSEMKFIAQLAKHSHLQLAKRGEFQCRCCSVDAWKILAKDAAIEPPPSCREVATVSHGLPEDIVVKIEPHQMMNNGDDDSADTPRGHHLHHADGLFSLDHQIQHLVGGTHGNHQQASSFLNGGTIDPSGSSTSNLSSSTNDGFMLDHQLRIQQHLSPSGQQNLQAFASLMNNSAVGGQSTNPDGSAAQPFFTFLLQNGELKVMQVVSSLENQQQGTAAITNGEVQQPPPSFAPTTTRNPSKAKHQHHNQLQTQTPIPQMTLSDLVSLPTIGHVCSMPGCGAKFDERQLLQNHERTCSLKKYPCSHPGCDRRFKNSKQRHAHMTSRHRGSENAFRCTVPECAAFFKTADRLKVHESRCRFKYEQFQLMDVEEAGNNNHTSYLAVTNHLSVPNLNSSTESIEPHQGPNAAFASLHAASINPEFTRVSVVNSSSRSKVDTSGLDQVRGTPDLQGFSTVDLSLVKSETMN